MSDLEQFEKDLEKMRKLWAIEHIEAWRLSQ